VPAVPRRLEPVTAQPAPASRSAQARPIPSDAPVMSTTRADCPIWLSCRVRTLGDHRRHEQAETKRERLLRAAFSVIGERLPALDDGYEQPRSRIERVQDLVALRPSWYVVRGDFCALAVRLSALRDQLTRWRPRPGSGWPG
jgi:hypothetical protein